MLSPTPAMWCAKASRSSRCRSWKGRSNPAHERTTLALLFSAFLNLPLPSRPSSPRRTRSCGGWIRSRNSNCSGGKMPSPRSTMSPTRNAGSNWSAKRFSSLIGGLPDYNGPLNPRVTGRIQGEGYTIEKVIFESLPGFYVTANLYRPNQPGRYPGVLLQAGHTQEGKPEGQRLAANLGVERLRRAGVRSRRPRRTRADLRSARGPAAGRLVGPRAHTGGSAEHSDRRERGRYFIWDAKRALDYLASRPEVDPAHLGAVGCSGGGALTTFIGALDPRIKAVAPACFINSYRLLFAGPDPDSEMSPPNLLASGLDMADYVELSAPTPWLILATDGDYFTPAGARLVYEEARRWFGLYGAEDKLRFFVGPGPHGTPLETREAIYEWMIRWLKDGHGRFSRTAGEDLHQPGTPRHTKRPCRRRAGQPETLSVDPGRVSRQETAGNHTGIAGRTAQAEYSFGWRRARSEGIG